MTRHDRTKVCPAIVMYHPGNISYNVPFKQDESPPFGDRIVTTGNDPVLYDANERPIYRKIGYR